MYKKWKFSFSRTNDNEYMYQKPVCFKKRNEIDTWYLYFKD